MAKLSHAYDQGVAGKAPFFFEGSDARQRCKKVANQPVAKNDVNVTCLWKGGGGIFSIPAILFLP